MVTGETALGLSTYRKLFSPALEYNSIGQASLSGKASSDCRQCVDKKILISTLLSALLTLQTPSMNVHPETYLGASLMVNDRRVRFSQV